MTDKESAIDRLAAFIQDRAERACLMMYRRSPNETVQSVLNASGVSYDKLKDLLEHELSEL